MRKGHWNEKLARELLLRDTQVGTDTSSLSSHTLESG